MNEHNFNLVCTTILGILLACGLVLLINWLGSDSGPKPFLGAPPVSDKSFGVR